MDSDLQLEQIFHRHFEKLESSRYSQGGSDYPFYEVDEYDPVDREIGRVVNANRTKLRIPILKVDKGYLVGTDI